jgi:hypothetical protein
MAFREPPRALALLALIALLCLSQPGRAADPAWQGAAFEGDRVFRAALP